MNKRARDWDGGEMKINHLFQSKKAVALLIILLMISAFFFDICALADDPLSNTVSVVAESESISDDLFLINVTCTPGEQIKSYEVELSFDPSVFTVNSVSEGDFFSGYDTFFNNGTIDNSAGSVTDVYGLIVGSGMVDSSGVLVQLNCAVVSEGSCAVEITSAGLTNNTMYLSVNTVNETVTVDQSGPVISSVQYSASNPLDTDSSFGWLNLSCVATDTQGIDSVMISVICPNSSELSRDCSLDEGNVWFWNSSQDSLFTDSGNYSFLFTVIDSSGNENSSSMRYVEISANWDMNIDHVCDLLDFVAVSNVYGDSNAKLGWIREDVDNNGEISVLDFVMLSNEYESTW